METSDRSIQVALSYRHGYVVGTEGSKSNLGARNSHAPTQSRSRHLRGLRRACRPVGNEASLCPAGRLRQRIFAEDRFLTPTASIAWHQEFEAGSSGVAPLRCNARVFPQRTVRSKSPHTHTPRLTLQLSALVYGHAARVRRHALCVAVSVLTCCLVGAQI